METFDAKEDQAYHLSVNLVVEDTKEIKKEINNDDKKKKRTTLFFFGACVFLCELKREIQRSNRCRQDPRLSPICTALQNK